ncbi:YihY/virulence factor BrkB family protein [Chloroflexota bacterium]
MKSEGIRTFVTDLSGIWTAERPARLAAALSYYAMFSLAPMLYVAIAVVGFFIDEGAVVDRLVVQIADNLGPEMVQLIQDLVAGASLSTSVGSPLATLISAGVLLYGATGLFSQLQYALNAIWEVPPATYAGTIAAIKNRLLAFVMVLGLALLLILATFASVLVSVFGTWFGWAGSAPIATQVAFVGLLTVTFVLIYKVVPDEEIAWRDVWAGAAITALLFSAGRWAIGFYLSHSGVATAFQAAGALAMLLIAIYYLAQIFLFGAVFTRVYASHFGSKREG